VNRGPSVQSASPGQPKCLASREARPRRLKGELKIAAIGGSYHVCVRACDGGFFPVPYVGDRDSLTEICQALCPNAETQLYSMPFGGTADAGSPAVDAVQRLPAPKTSISVEQMMKNAADTKALLNGLCGCGGHRR
jgi:hypothetical protein